MTTYRVTSDKPSGEEVIDCATAVFAARAYAQHLARDGELEHLPDGRSFQVHVYDEDHPTVTNKPFWVTVHRTTTTTVDPV
jgi:hypothetical protein